MHAEHKKVEILPWNRLATLPRDTTCMDLALALQLLWVVNVQDYVDNIIEVDKTSMVTWASFFADRFKGSKQHLSAETAIKILLPVLDESFCNLSTIVHSLRIV